MPTIKTEWNVNTIISLVGFLASFVLMGVSWGTLTARVDNLDEKFTQHVSAEDQLWDDHQQLHKDRRAELVANTARTDDRIKVVESEIRKYDNLDYRITVQERAAAELRQTGEQLRDQLTAVASDVRVVKEILQRGALATPPGELSRTR